MNHDDKIVQNQNTLSGWNNADVKNKEPENQGKKGKIALFQTTKQGTKQEGSRLYLNNAVTFHTMRVNTWFTLETGQQDNMLNSYMVLEWDNLLFSWQNRVLIDT